VPETRSRRDAAARHASYDDSAGAEGVISKVVDRACDNPAMTGGLFVMALTASAIVSNALFLQNVHHPEPLFATRPPLIVDRSPPPTPPLPPERNEQEVQTTAISPPLPRPAPVAPAVSTTPSAPSVEQSLVRAVQTALAQEGYYLGAIEGRFPDHDTSRSLFTYFINDEAETARIAREGGYPWWIHEGVRSQIFRPLSDLLLRIDHALFGRSPLGYHLHSLAWWAATLGIGGTICLTLWPSDAGSSRSSRARMSAMASSPECTK